jgi:hypothetical protein
MRICREMLYPIFVRLLTGLTIGWLSLLSVRGAVAGVMDSEPRPLVVPTPSGPSLRRPEVQVPPPSLMLEKRPLQIMPNQSRPTLNVLPQADPDGAANDDLEESAPTDVDGRRRSLHLQHFR